MQVNYYLDAVAPENKLNRNILRDSPYVFTWKPAEAGNLPADRRGYGRHRPGLGLAAGDHHGEVAQDCRYPIFCPTF